MAEVADLHQAALPLLPRGRWTLLDKKGVKFTEIEAGFDPELSKREMMQKASGRSTFPQIFIDGKHIGGCDDMMALERAGKLDPLLAA